MKSNNTSSNSAYMLILLILLILVSCRERVIPPDNGNGIHVPKLKIEAEDIGVTDCFIRLKFLDTSNVEAKIFLLTRDGQTILTSQCSSLDTLILDEGLLPKRAYTYKAFLHNSNNPPLQSPVDSCAPLLIITMDTTSHNFSWEITYLGDGASSVLRDVAILSDTLAYAVGEIYKKDSLGQWETEMYNMAKWNGKEWKLTKAYFEYQGHPYVTQLYSIYAFSENDIWVGTGGPYHWNGNKWTASNIGSAFSGRVNKFWGTSSSNLYMVGTNGALAHFNGSSWRRLESPEGASVTDVNLTDVWGSPDGSVVWACGYDEGVPPGTVLLRIRGGQVQSIRVKDQFSLWPDSLSGSIKAVWTDHINQIHVLSSWGVYRCPLASRGEAKLIPLWLAGSPAYYGYTKALRGIAVNDLIFCGFNGLIWHFNGITLKRFEENSNSDLIFRSIAYTQQRRQLSVDFFVAVGDLYHPIHSKGVVMIGRR